MDVRNSGPRRGHPDELRDAGAPAVLGPDPRAVVRRGQFRLASALTLRCTGWCAALTLCCAPEGTRTPNLLIRSQMLYPLSYGRSVLSQHTHRPDTRRLRDSNPGGALKPQPH